MDFSSLFSHMPDSTMGYINLAGIVIAAGSVAAASISKYTENKTDDKIAAALKKAHDIFGFFGFHPSFDDKREGTKPPTAKVHDIRDHRTSEH